MSVIIADIIDDRRKISVAPGIYQPASGRSKLSPLSIPSNDDACTGSRPEGSP